VKSKISEVLTSKIQKECTKTKLRFIQEDKYERKKYVDECSVLECKRIMRVRLNMTSLNSNYKGTNTNVMCTACNNEEETTEHVMNCEIYKKLTGQNIQQQKITNSNVANLKIIANYFDTITSVKEEIMN